jgi:hypothetical protein
MVEWCLVWIVLSHTCRRSEADVEVFACRILRLAEALVNR